MGWVVFRIAFLYLSLILLVVPGCAATALQKETGEISRQVSNVDSQDQLTVNERYWLSMNLAHEKCKQYVWKDGDSRLFYPADESPEKYPKLYFSCMVENKVTMPAGRLSQKDQQLISIIEGNSPVDWSHLSWAEIAYKKYGIDRFSPAYIAITPNQFKNENDIPDSRILVERCQELHVDRLSFPEELVLAEHANRHAGKYWCLGRNLTLFRHLSMHCLLDRRKCAESKLLRPAAALVVKRIQRIDGYRVKSKEEAEK